MMIQWGYTKRERGNTMNGREPARRFLNFRGDSEALADCRKTMSEIKALLPRANKMYLDVPAHSRSIDVVQAALHLYLESLEAAIHEIESEV